MLATKTLHLFQAYGVELEYMIVDKDTLKVNAITDEVLRAVAGEYVSDVELEEIAWSNELVLHVIELKTNGPSAKLTNLPEFFQKNLQKINSILDKHNACLLPTGAHPFMDPHTETKLWPHENNVIYDKYNEIFSCQGHGWSNLQSTHLNLPFATNDEFVRLHTAIRLLLPIIPALSASTPILEGKLTGFQDTRLEYYRKNQQHIPAITGLVIPEAVTSITDYQNKILAPMYNAIAPYDQEKILQEEWLNSRGAIARFDRNAIEIRVIDIQESAYADLAILALVVGVLKMIVRETWSNLDNQLTFHESDLSNIFLGIIKDGQHAKIDNHLFLKALGFKDKECTARELWQHLYLHLQQQQAIEPQWHDAVAVILQQGTLAERILNALPKNRIDHKDIVAVYHKLASCLAHGTMFSQ